MQATDSTVQTLASEAYAWFESATRGDTGNDEDRYVRMKDGCPEWVTELVREAHGEMFPDDWKYGAIRSALGSISDDGYDEDDGAHEFADSEVDVYTGARYAWLSSNLSRQGYIDEAIEEGGMQPTGDVAEMIGWGQYGEAREVFESVVRSLTAELEAREQVQA